MVLSALLGVGAKGAVGAASGGGGAAAGGGGGLVTAIAEGNILAKGIISVLKGMWKTLKESSGHLKASLTIASQAFKLALRPMADTIGLFLRPFAIGMLRWGITFYKKFAGKTLGEIFLGGGDEEPAAGGGLGGIAGEAGESLLNKLGVSDEAQEKAGSALRKFFSEEGPLAKMGETLNEKFEAAREALNEVFGTFLSDKLGKAGEKLNTWIEGGRENMRVWLTEKVPTFLEEGYSWFTDGTYKDDLKRWLKEGFSWFKDGDFLTDMTTWLKEGWDKLKTGFFDMVNWIIGKVNIILPNSLDIDLIDYAEPGVL